MFSGFPDIHRTFNCWHYLYLCVIAITAYKAQEVKLLVVEIRCNELYSVYRKYGVNIFMSWYIPALQDGLRSFLNDERLRIYNIVEKMLKFLPVLSDRYQNLVYKDSCYGEIIKDDWLKELDRFFKLVIARDNRNNYFYKPQDKNIIRDYYDIELSDFSLQSIFIKIIFDKDLDYDVKVFHTWYDSVRLADFENSITIKKDKNKNIISIPLIELCSYKKINKTGDPTVPTEIVNLRIDYVKLIDILFDFLVENNFIKISALNCLDGTKKPIEYESIVATNLSNLGFITRTTSISGDFGVDILAEKNGISFAIQCKMYSAPVGINAVQEISSGRIHYKQDYGVVVSNASFTKAARELAKTNNIILLKDNELDKLLKFL